MRRRFRLVGARSIELLSERQFWICVEYTASHALRVCGKMLLSKYGPTRGYISSFLYGALVNRLLGPIEGKIVAADVTKAANNLLIARRRTSLETMGTKDGLTSSF